MNGYTTIVIGGKTIGLKFGMYSIRKFSEKSEKGILYDGENLNELGISTLLHSGYLNNCIVKEVEPELSYENFVDFVEGALMDEKDKAQIQQAVECWADSRFIKQSIEAANDDAKKKKLPGKKLKK